MVRQTAQNSSEKICRQIYEKTGSFYKEISNDLKDDPGFQILYGPPFFETPVLFLGYQPGKGCKTALEERKYGSERRWPKRTEFATECWPLAVNLRRMFGGEFLERCVGTNAIYIRANSLDDYNKYVDDKLRAKIGEFCFPLVEQMLSAIQPRLVVAIGFATLNLFGGGDADEKSAKSGRVLTRTGQIFGRDALGVLHLTGARISNQDRETISCRIKSSINYKLRLTEVC
jgi:hypothetical protein